jgi:hypothetical protein
MFFFWSTAKHLVIFQNLPKIFFFSEDLFELLHLIQSKISLFFSLFLLSKANIALCDNTMTSVATVANYNCPVHSVPLFQVLTGVLKFGILTTIP